MRLITDPSLLVAVRQYLFIVLLLGAHPLYSSHIRGGEIIVDRVDCSSREFIITVIGYVDLQSIVEFGNGELRFGDGSAPIARLRDEAELVAEEYS